MTDSNIIKIDDISRKKSISIKQAAEILDENYHTARRIILNSREIGFFDYGGHIRVVEEDVRRYKVNHYVAPTRR